MIYLDTSAALAQIFLEPERPPAALWREPLVSSQLLSYEIWVRLHARGLGASHGESARRLLAQVALLDLSPHVLARAEEAFPVPVRTLDALHLASMHHLRERGEHIELASYDDRLLAAAGKLGFRACL